MSDPLRTFARLTLAAVLATASALFTSPTPSTVRAATAADPSDVVLVFDFSASILLDEATRNAFADALDRIATQVDEIERAFLDSGATVSFVRFASSTTDVPGCVQLSLRDDLDATSKVADCLQDVAAAYRAGAIDP